MEFYISPNRDGVHQNITTSIRDGETLHIITVDEKDSDRAVQAFKLVAQDMKISVCQNNHGGVVTSGVLTMTFGRGDEEKKRMDDHIRTTLIRKSGLKPA